MTTDAPPRVYLNGREVGTGWDALRTACADAPPGSTVEVSGLWVGQLSHQPDGGALGRSPEFDAALAREAEPPNRGVVE